jgi:para-aminobenzoate synthetase component I
MREINVSADRLVAALLALPEEKNLCLLDSCGVGHLGSHLLIAGFAPIEVLEISDSEAAKTLARLDEKLSQTDLAAVFTISYDFGLKLENIAPREKEFSNFAEPDVFLALFDALIIHDYDAKKTFLAGNEAKFDEIENAILKSADSINLELSTESSNSKLFSNFTKFEYENAVEKIKERIRDGDTYQTNLTRQIRVELAENGAPEQIFQNLRKNHPAPFAAFLRRKKDVVISASPERFFRVESENKNSRLSTLESRLISVSPIKGTRPRGKTFEEDLRLKNELLNSEKDRAENVMIVDLLRNDIGRICEFGSVKVEKLCDLEEHPTLFHLVSTVSGALRENVKFSDIIRAVFPCGSITGAPKISTMRIIDEIETAPRSLSMGAIGYYVPSLKSQVSSQMIDSIFDLELGTWDLGLDASVAIRTMVVRGREAIFNVGGGIVIDSDAEDEFAETVVKSKALLESIGIFED